MSGLTYAQAVDEMLALFKAAWVDTAHYGAVYEDLPGAKPTAQDTWARPVVRFADGHQGSLGDTTTGRMWTRVGSVIVQVFTPVGRGLSPARVAANIVAKAYEGVASPGGVWFRNVRLQEIGADGDFVQVNVVADFTYDEVH
jgi:hypothetical protein